MIRTTIIEKLYSTIDTYTIKYRNETEFPDEVGSPVYGEVTKKGVETLLTYFESYFNKNTVFYDVGSGFSKMVLHIALLKKIKKCVGVEYSKERHEGALLLKKMCDPYVESVNLINDDIFKVDLSDATIVYCDNTVMSPDFGKKLYDKIPKGCLFLYKRTINDVKEKIHRDKDLKIERSYGDSYLCYLIKE